MIISLAVTFFILSPLSKMHAGLRLRNLAEYFVMGVTLRKENVNMAQCSLSTESLEHSFLICVYTSKEK